MAVVRLTVRQPTKAEMLKKSFIRRFDLINSLKHTIKQPPRKLFTMVNAPFDCILNQCHRQWVQDECWVSSSFYRSCNRWFC